MTGYSGKAGLALTTGCALLALSQRAGADIFFATAQEPANRQLAYIDPHRFTPKIGTLGAGFEYRLSLNDHTALRLDRFTREHQRSVRNDFYRYTLHGKLHTNTLAFDWHPFGGAFRSSVGMTVNNLDVGGYGATSGRVALDLDIGQTDVVNFLARPEVQQALAANSHRLVDHGIDLDALVAQFNGASASYTLDYSGIVTANARVKWRRTAPYLGFGWNGTAIRGGLRYSFDVGAIYIGRPTVELSIGGPVVDAIEQTHGAELRAYVEEERREMENKLSRYRVLPVISVGLFYRF
jgi:hypothetical protein